MAKSYEDIGLNDKLQNVNSLAVKPPVKQTLYDFRSSLPRGALRQVGVATNEILTFSNIGSATGVVIGSAGSGTEQVRVTSTLSSRRSAFDVMLANEEFSFYQGTIITGTADIRGTNFSGLYNDWTIENFLQYQPGNRFNLVAMNAIRREVADLGTVSFRNIWRALQPPGGARET